MAKKKDNTIFWIAGLGLAGYLYYKHTQAPANNTATAALPAAANPGPVLALPPSTAINNNVPAGSSGSNAPNLNAVNTTNLQPAAITNINSVPTLLPGQALAIAPNGAPLLSNQGVPLVFTGSSPQNDPGVLAAEIAQRDARVNMINGWDEGEAL